MTDKRAEHLDEAMLRRRLAVRCALFLAAAGLLGLGIGWVANIGERLATGVCASALLIAVTAVPGRVTLHRDRARAGRHGLSLSRYAYLGEQIRRGRPPTDAALRPAVLEVAERQSLAVEQASSKPVQALRVSAIVLVTWPTVDRILRQEYGLGALYLCMILSTVWAEVSVRRRRRRLGTVRRKLDEHV
ncbi:hypothetical protein [Streptomyces mesophilus]|uniref:hypothetical protein n=1 Tax=Streptomyces mesophilus TaxID=1775132 RepID=UPI0033306B3A